MIPTTLMHLSVVIYFYLFQMIFQFDFSQILIKVLNNWLIPIAYPDSFML